jgi:plastocyanin domain-containing protein
MARCLVLAITLAALRVAAGEPASEAPPAGARAPATSTAHRVEIKVTDAGFEPRQVKVKRGQPTTLAFTRVTDRTCITAIDIPAEGVKGLALPLNRTVTLTITPARRGIESFHCSAMGMGNGKLIVED